MANKKSAQKRKDGQQKNDAYKKKQLALAVKSTLIIKEKENAERNKLAKAGKTTPVPTEPELPPEGESPVDLGGETETAETEMDLGTPAPELDSNAASSVANSCYDLLKVDMPWEGKNISEYDESVSRSNALMAGEKPDVGDGEDQVCEEEVNDEIEVDSSASRLKYYQGIAKSNPGPSKFQKAKEALGNFGERIKNKFNFRGLSAKQLAPMLAANGIDPKNAKASIAEKLVEVRKSMNAGRALGKTQSDILNRTEQSLMTLEKEYMDPKKAKKYESQSFANSLAKKMSKDKVATKVGIQRNNLVEKLNSSRDAFVAMNPKPTSPSGEPLTYSEHMKELMGPAGVARMNGQKVGWMAGKIKNGMATLKNNVSKGLHTAKNYAVSTSIFLAKSAGKAVVNAGMAVGKVAADAAVAAYDEYGQPLVDKAVDKASDIAGKVSDKASDLAGKAVGIASDTYDQYGKDKVDFIKGKASDVSEKVSQTASNVAGKAVDKASDLAGKAVGIASDVGEKVSQTASNVVGKVSDVAGKAVDTVSNVATTAYDEYARDKVDYAVDATKTVANATGKVAGKVMGAGVTAGAVVVGGAIIGAGKVSEAFKSKTLTGVEGARKVNQKGIPGQLFNRDPAQRAIFTTILTKMVGGVRPQDAEKWIEEIMAGGPDTQAPSSAGDKKKEFFQIAAALHPNASKSNPGTKLVQKIFFDVKNKALAGEAGENMTKEQVDGISGIYKDSFKQQATEMKSQMQKENSKSTNTNKGGMER